MAGWKRTPFWTYLILQLPGVLLAGVILLLLYRWGVLPLAWAIGLFVAWAAKDLALYPLVKDAFAPARTGPESLIGARARGREGVLHQRIECQVLRGPRHEESDGPRQREDPPPVQEQ